MTVDINMTVRMAVAIDRLTGDRQGLLEPTGREAASAVGVCVWVGGCVQ